MRTEKNCYRALLYIKSVSSFLRYKPGPGLYKCDSASAHHTVAWHKPDDGAVDFGRCAHSRRPLPLRRCFCMPGELSILFPFHKHTMAFFSLITFISIRRRYPAHCLIKNWFQSWPNAHCAVAALSDFSELLQQSSVLANCSIFGRTLWAPARRFANRPVEETYLSVPALKVVRFICELCIKAYQLILCIALPKGATLYSGRPRPCTHSKNLFQSARLKCLKCSANT